MLRERLSPGDLTGDVKTIPIGRDGLSIDLTAPAPPTPSPSPPPVRRPPAIRRASLSDYVP
jgi:hypothetical protein